MTTMGTGAAVVLTTVAGLEEAHALARTLVEEQLAACVNVLPEMTSHYRWEGRVHQEPEHLLIIKTMEARLADLRTRLHQLHRYDLPEFLVLPVAGGSPAYLEWLASSSRPR